VFVNGLGQILQLGTQQIFISNFVLDEDVFETVIEVSSFSIDKLVNSNLKFYFALGWTQSRVLGVIELQN